VDAKSYQRWSPRSLPALKLKGSMSQGHATTPDRSTAPDKSKQKGERCNESNPRSSEREFHDFTHIHFGNLGHAIVALALMLSLPATAMAQYGRGGMGRHPHTQEACDRPTGQEV
jgi:hypothetical protein